MDEITRLVERISSGWVWLVSLVSSITAGIVFGWKYFRQVRDAFRLSAAVYAQFGDNAPTALQAAYSEILLAVTVRELRVTLIEQALGAAIWVCRADNGAWIQSNMALCELFGLDQAALRDFGWLEAVDHPERLSCYDHWSKCVKDKIPYEGHYTITNQRTGRRFRCHARAHAAKSRDGTLLCYVGTVEVVACDISST